MVNEIYGQTVSTWKTDKGQMNKAIRPPKSPDCAPGQGENKWQ
jgi:hypothetical protein